MAQGQKEIFEGAKKAISTELNPEILAWSFSEMLSQLRALIANKYPSSRERPVRSFCRRYLGMHGESYHEAQDWLSEKAFVPPEKVQLILRVLKSARDGTLSPAVTQKPEPEPATPGTTGMVRKLVDHTTTLFNSLMILVVEAGVSRRDLYDGDRIQIRIALKRVCDAFGIDVIFPEPEAARNQPVTRKEFAGLGLRTQERKRP
jgi:hypothetical protein